MARFFVTAHFEPRELGLHVVHRQFEGNHQQFVFQACSHILRDRDQVGSYLVASSVSSSVFVEFGSPGFELFCENQIIDAKTCT
jgi:hypothetical protein